MKIDCGSVLKFFDWRLLKTRVTVLTLTIFLLSLWSLAFYASRTLRDDMQRQLGEQQFSTLTLIAAQIDQELDERLRGLERLAGEITPQLLDDPVVLQSFLEQRLIFQNQFNGGVFATGTAGTAIADVPRSAGRIGTNYLDRETVAVPLASGASIIGRPAPGKKLLAPIFSIAAPVKDGRGRVIGVLVGTINLGKPNFLDRIMHSGYGRTGGYLLIAPQHRLFVTATDKSRVMQPISLPGINRMLDRYLQGYEGYGVAVSSRGIEELTAAKAIPAAGWLIASALPSAEAFAPVVAMQWRMLLATILLTVLAGGLTWSITAWMLRRQLAPVLAATRTLSDLSASERPALPLPVISQDEFGQLIGSVNRLLETARLRETALQESEGRFRALADNASAMVWMAGLDRQCNYFNKIWLDFTGRTSAEECGEGWAQGVHPQDLARCLASYAQAFDARQPFTLEYRLRRRDGQYRWLTDHGVPRHDAQGVFLGYIGSCLDISDRMQAAERLQLAASVFTHAREGITIAAADGTIIEVNEAFCRITGFAHDEVIGQNPRILKSGRQDEQFYLAMWRELIDKGHWAGEMWNRRKNGEIYASILTISAVRDHAGQTQHYVALFSDISTLKAQQTQLERIAHFDPLTALPNRVLLADRLQQAMAQTQRRGQRLAVVFLDLDGFKAVNDRYGHDVGDQLLVAVATRMKHDLRDSDTLARLGGDEFVAVLLELTDAASVPMLARLLAAAAQPVCVGALTLQVSASLGVTFFPQADEVDADQLLRQADQAMYRAKLAGKNRYHVFDAGQERGRRSHREIVGRSV